MAERIRTTKKLAQRINRDYFKKRFPLPRWRMLLSIGAVIAGLVWLGWQALARSEQPYTSGPLTTSHTLFSSRCNACHVASGSFAKAVTNDACNSCHNGPIHHAQQTMTPACVECHVEHKGEQLLKFTSDKACTNCHADLKMKNGEPPKVAARIQSFTSGHPEFAALRPGRSDPGTIKFNHQVHMKKGLRSPRGNVDLTCNDCHRPVPVEAKPTVNVRGPHSRMSGRALMEPVDYYAHCSSCHSLQFDRLINEPAPHKKPEIVKEFVRNKLAEYIATHPDQIRRTEDGAGRIPTRPPWPPPRNAAEWVQGHVADAEFLLFNKTCKECHPPDFPKANLTTRWLPEGEFDHNAHQMVDCRSCHEKAESSRLTSDVLLPGIAVCQRCHIAGRTDAARGSCDECHQYHDWTKEQPAHRSVNGSSLPAASSY